MQQYNANNSDHMLCGTSLKKKYVAAICMWERNVFLLTLPKINVVPCQIWHAHIETLHDLMVTFILDMTTCNIPDTNIF